MKWLEEIHKNDLREVGKKAFELSRLKRAGFSVPDGFSITRSTCEKMFSDESGFKNNVKSKKLISENALHDQITEKILSGFRKLGFCVAVRSSAVEEDRPDASFAGQYQTVLNVSEENDLFQAIKKCFSSQFLKQVQEYARRKKISGEKLRLSIFIQKQIQPDASGVLFTVNPVTGDDKEMMVEAVKGLGEPLVSGKTQPDRYLINVFSEEIMTKDICTEQEEHFKGIDSKVIRKTGPLLEEKVIFDLVRMAMKIQTLYGCPQDIEWAVENGKIHILQTRPVTAMGYQSIEGEWTTADFRDGGVSSEVVTPFMWSLYERVFESAMHSYLKQIHLIRENNIIRWSNVFFGRPYWNVGAVKKALAGMPGFNERSFDQDLGIEITYEDDGVVTPMSALGVLRAIHSWFALKKMYSRQYSETQKAITNFKHYLKFFKVENLSKIENKELEMIFEDLVYHRHFELETAYFKTIFNTANARLDFKAIIDKANKKGAALEYLPLITALRPLKPIIPLFELWEISRHVRRDPKVVQMLETRNMDQIFEHPYLGKKLKHFFIQYGHHSIRELDLRVSRWFEDPTFVIETILSYSKLEDDQNPQSHVKINQTIFDTELNKMNRFFSGCRVFQRKRFIKKLKNVRFHTWYKEEVRDWSTRLYSHIRCVSLEVGRRLMKRGILDQEDHIFYLSFSEVINILRDKNPDRQLIDRRIEANKAYMLSFRHFESPNEIGRRWQYRNESAKKKSDTRSIYKGISCSFGKTTGVVRVVQDMSEVDKLRTGDILVTRFTDPGWTPLFPLISGVITETGGILSHAAVIAREYGIPAILSVQNATVKLEDGQRVILDGNKGEVQILC